MTYTLLISTLFCVLLAVVCSLTRLDTLSWVFGFFAWVSLMLTIFSVAVRFW